MKQQFDIFLKNEKVKYYRLIALLLVLMNGLFLASQWSSITGKRRTFPVIALVTVVLYLIFAIVERIRKQAEPDGWHRTVLLFSALLYVKTDYWYLALINFALVAFDFVVRRRLIVRVSPTHIEYPSFPSRKIKWNELNNVVLKDDLLTIDFKSDKLIQQYILSGDEELPEADFNEFCRQQLLANK